MLVQDEDDTDVKKLAATAPKNESATALTSADSNPEKCLSAACSLPVEQVRAELDLGRSKYRAVNIDGVQLMVAQPKLDSASSVGRIVTTRDVLTGVYEGGMKVWECSLDLVRFLASNPSTIGKSGLVSNTKSSADAVRHLDSLPVINVLELGCGHGLPGIFTLKKFPNCKVCFQDLNEEVLQYTTASNVVYNAGREATDTRACFVRGDWTSASFVPKLFEIAKCRSFDVVLAAETLYTKSSSVIMSQLLWQLLTPK